MTRVCQPGKRRKLRWHLGDGEAEADAPRYLDLVRNVATGSTYKVLSVQPLSRDGKWRQLQLEGLGELVDPTDPGSRLIPYVLVGGSEYAHRDA